MKKSCIYKSIILLICYMIVFMGVCFGKEQIHAHIIIVPIILSAYFINVYVAIIGALLIILIPSIFTSQSNENIGSLINRFIFFSYTGVAIGSLVKLLQEQFSNLQRLVKFDTITHLPKRIVLISDLENLIIKTKKFSLGAIYIENIREIFNMIGPSKEEIILSSISKFLEKNKIDENIKIYNSNSLNFEFLLIDYNEDELKEWSQLFIRNLKNNILIIEKYPVYLNFSFGATYSNSSYETPDSYIRETYGAVEYAYKNSMNSYIYDSHLEKHYFTTYLISQVDAAIDNNEFYIEYQPKYNLLTNKMDGVEALIRWNHTKLGRIAPNDFIPKLEKTDTIKKVTYWLIEKVIEDIKHLKFKGIDLTVAINVCPKDLEDFLFTEILLKKFTENNLSSNNIELEITESSFISNIDLILQNLSVLNRNGIRIYIDDFGTGYSSLSYLSSLPIDYIKIDRSLIKDITRNPKKKCLIENLIDLAYKLKKSVVAEGIEDQETLNLLKELGCQKIQGYYYAKPMKIDCLEKFIFLEKNNKISK